MPAHAEVHAHPNYLRVYAILVALLLVSVFGPMLGIRMVTLVAAFGVALVKAYMVARNFMHLNVEKRWIHWALALVLAFMVLLYAGVSPDVGRDSGQRWVKTPGWHHLPPSQEKAETGKDFGESGH